MAQDSELNLLVKAMSFAAHKHKNQRRKGKDASPYINHPIGLAEVLVNVGNVTDINAICAALLHDTIEDTRTTREELTEIFGAEISDIVMEVTDDKSLCKAERKQAQIDHAMHLSKQARAVKLADKICNLGDVANLLPTGRWQDGSSILTGPRMSLMACAVNGRSWRPSSTDTISYAQRSNPLRVSRGSRFFQS